MLKVGTEFKTDSGKHFIIKDISVEICPVEDTMMTKLKIRNMNNDEGELSLYLSDIVKERFFKKIYTILT